MTLDQIEYYELLKVALSEAKTNRLLDGLNDSNGIEKQLILKELREREIEA